jgi:hypothetical protein
MADPAINVVPNYLRKVEHVLKPRIAFASFHLLPALPFSGDGDHFDKAPRPIADYLKFYHNL